MKPIARIRRALFGASDPWPDLRDAMKDPENQARAMGIVRDLASGDVPVGDRMAKAEAMLIEHLDRRIKPGSPLAEALSDAAIRIAVRAWLQAVYAQLKDTGLV